MKSDWNVKIMTGWTRWKVMISYLWDWPTIFRTRDPIGHTPPPTSQSNALVPSAFGALCCLLQSDKEPKTFLAVKICTLPSLFLYLSNLAISAECEVHFSLMTHLNPSPFSSFPHWPLPPPSSSVCRKRFTSCRFKCTIFIILVFLPPLPPTTWLCMMLIAPVLLFMFLLETSKSCCSQSFSSLWLFFFLIESRPNGWDPLSLSSSLCFFFFLSLCSSFTGQASKGAPSVLRLCLKKGGRKGGQSLHDTLLGRF